MEGYAMTIELPRSAHVVLAKRYLKKNHKGEPVETLGDLFWRAVTDPVIVGNATLYLGDCLEVMAGLPDGSVDAVICDPPPLGGRSASMPHFEEERWMVARRN
jgi:hypothetical protein